jgi:nucleoside-diphosphate-sugar epimerase
MRIKAIITGATGMVGEGVLHECLNHPDVERVLVINRRPGGASHPKLTEVIHGNLWDVSPIASQLAGYNACFFCLGVSAVGLKEPEYQHIIYDLTLHVAETLVGLNPDMTFCFISGMGTDSSEGRRQMWARVKGRTENQLLKLPFQHAYMFRPGYLHPTPGLGNTLGYYKYITWMYPVLRRIFPGAVSTLAELGQAMINAVRLGYNKPILEVRDIVRLAHARAVEL